MNVKTAGLLGALVVFLSAFPDAAFPDTVPAAPRPTPVPSGSYSPTPAPSPSETPRCGCEEQQNECSENSYAFSVTGLATRMALNANRKERTTQRALSRSLKQTERRIAKGRPLRISEKRLVQQLKSIAEATAALNITVSEPDALRLGALDKITGKMCRDACNPEKGKYLDLPCQLLCGQLKNCSCSGLWALCEHLMRHSRNTGSKLCVSTYLQSGCPDNTMASNPVGSAVIPGDEQIDPATLQIGKTSDGWIELVATAPIGYKIFLYESDNPDGPWSLVRVPPEPREPQINRPRPHNTLPVIAPVRYSEVWRLPADQAKAYFKVRSEPWAPLA